jgi:hypothetical protein
MARRGSLFWRVFARGVQKLVRGSTAALGWWLDTFLLL